MHRPLVVLAVLGASLLPGVPAGAAPECQTRIDDDHALKASGSSARVRTRPGGAKVLVLRGVEPRAQRVAVEDGDAVCRIDLERFAAHWTKLTYPLHARLRGPGGSWAVRVRFVSYDPDRRILRTRGRLTDHRGASRIVKPPNTTVTYASTFVPFDSSF